MQKQNLSDLYPEKFHIAEIICHCNILFNQDQIFLLMIGCKNANQIGTDCHSAKMNPNSINEYTLIIQQYDYVENELG